MSSSIADDARKIAEALQHYSDQYCEGWCSNGGNFDDCGGCRARAALPIAESLPGKIELLTRRAADAESQLIHARMRWDHYLAETCRAKAIECELAAARADGIKEAAAWAALKAAHYGRQLHDPLGNEERFADIARSILKLLDPKEPNASPIMEIQTTQTETS